ncbi:DUF4865 family protein [Amycolatopsis thermophila]|uniref:DUF4865 domain-containing protein n=1 Tax=Amycolatopsis thermophila TaxID=206084 RepID=A0ABU0F6M8_9PSEU|nr:DUF4865 family protein [Amycolatopsis thermophila]MDQ0383173.1 hypothetical protein [Amycolatopsis thermophila]
MQYELTLPADYDMGIIHHRVATRGHRTDAFPGLGLKAYLVRERGVHGSPVNQYAPFYLWHDTGGMARFLVGGGGFQGIVDDFGRPPVRHWTGIALQRGPARQPRAASRETTPFTELGDHLEQLADLARRDDVHTAALGVDPYSWELVRFTLWAHPGPGRYEVLHLSSPHLDEIPRGRLW